jgi:hypothetical protein
VRQPVVHERPVGPRHVERQLVEPVELGVRIGLVERDRELHLGAVAVEHDRLQPGRRAVQLDRRVDGLLIQVKHDRVVGRELVAGGLEGRDVVKLGVQALPFRLIDVDRVRPD